MTREQKLEQELAELRKAKNTLLDRLDDAGKKPLEEKAELFDYAHALIRTWLENQINQRGEVTDPRREIGTKALRAMLGEDSGEYLEKL